MKRKKRFLIFVISIVVNSDTLPQNTSKSSDPADFHK